VIGLYGLSFAVRHPSRHFSGRFENGRAGIPGEMWISEEIILMHSPDWRWKEFTEAKGLATYNYSIACESRIIQ
jgi:hypothetical protein